MPRLKYQWGSDCIASFRPEFYLKFNCKRTYVYICSILHNANLHHECGTQTKPKHYAFYALYTYVFIYMLIVVALDETNIYTVVSTNNDSDVIVCLQLLSKTLTCTLHMSYSPTS